MALTLVNLDTETRNFQLREILADIEAGTLYISKRLNPIGVSLYPATLQEAAQKYDDAWLATQLRDKFNTTEPRNLKGKTIQAKIPSNAAEMLAEGEFNRFYLRGLCLRAIRDNISNLIVYRAKQVNNPREDSNAKIGTTIDPLALLSDLRKNIGVETALGLPPGANSGLSAKLA